MLTNISLIRERKKLNWIKLIGKNKVKMAKIVKMDGIIYINIIYINIEDPTTKFVNSFQNTRFTYEDPRKFLEVIFFRD